MAGMSLLCLIFRKESKKSRIIPVSKYYWQVSKVDARRPYRVSCEVIGLSFQNDSNV